MRSASTVLIASLGLALFQADGAAARGPQDPRPTFRSGVELVTVTAVVCDRNGRPVQGLSRADFELYDAGERRAIVEFRSDPAPVNMAVLFDISGSMDVGEKLAHARDAVRHLLAWLDPGRDRVALFTFDTRLEQVQPFTTAPADVSRQLESLRAFGATSLYDAIAQTGRRLAAVPGPRRAVVVVTDGLDNASRLTAPEVSGIASSIDVPVYIVAVVSPLEHPEADTRLNRAVTFEAEGPLGSLARWTGGRLFVASVPAHASAAARQLLAELRHQYVMAFEPRAQPGWRPLSLRLRQKDLVVRTRSGYIAGTRPASHYVP